ncbi:hypothetical protein JL722_12281 [Aureococcus anophagefferens]|nr:hypothetical protein JL722_12281 [Aureococcus anophagefferens]
MSGGAAFTVDACLRVLKDTLDADRACALLADEFAGRRSLREEGFAPFDDVQDYVNLLGTACIVAARRGQGRTRAAGLTMGVVSLDATELRIMLRTASPSERRHAAVLLPLVEREPHHQVLVTLLLVNSFANEALPLFLDAIAPSWAAILFSVVAVLFFGEIIPSAFFTGRRVPHRRARAVVNVALAALSPIALPLAKVLDRVVPHEASYTSGDEMDEADLVRGAMALSKTSVGDVMVSAREVFSLPRDSTAGAATLDALRARSVSRVPLYARGDPRDGAEYLLVRELVGVAASDAVRLVDLPGAVFPALWAGRDQSASTCSTSSRRARRTWPSCPRTPRRAARVAAGEPLEAPAARGHHHAEDICEEILTEEIYDETDRQAAAKKISAFFARRLEGAAAPPPPPSPRPPARSPSAPIGALSFMAKGAQARRRLHRSASNPAPPPEQSRRGRSATAPTVTSPLVEASTTPPARGVAPAPPLDS